MDSVKQVNWGLVKLERRVCIPPPLQSQQVMWRCQGLIMGQMAETPGVLLSTFELSDAFLTPEGRKKPPKTEHENQYSLAFDTR